MELKKVLIIEDNNDIAEDVKKEFTANNVSVVHIRDDSEISEALFRQSEIQLIILDWFLDQESSTLAKLCLRKIRDICFIPVVVWTEELTSFEEEAEEIYKGTYPKAILIGCGKDQIKYDQLLSYLTNCIQVPQ
jgi:DNA-binding response OmpR family regulator